MQQVEMKKEYVEPKLAELGSISTITLQVAISPSTSQTF
jgi:hypothetical protein